MPAFAIEQQITFLYTPDLEATARFYEESLGLPLALDQGTCRIYQVSGAAFVGFCERQDTVPQPTGVILTLVTSKVDAWYQRLSGMGVPVEKAPALNARYNIYHCFVRDPNGYLVEIQQFLDPAWPGAEATVADPPI